MRVSSRHPFIVIGAGPYGLAVASHLRDAGFDVRVFGKVMDFWKSQMPKGMLLRSPWEGSHISDARQGLSLNRYESSLGVKLPRPLPREDFVRYGEWFQRQLLPDLDPRDVAGVERAETGFRVTLNDGECLVGERVIVAAGISPFAHVPPVFASLSARLVSHASDRSNVDLRRFSGKRVTVVGAGQSAIESAALLHESGAHVEVLIRKPKLRWLSSRPILEWLMDCRINPFKTPGKIGPIGINWLVEHPRLFTLAPRRLQGWMETRAIRAAASGWLRPRTERIAFTTARHVVHAAPEGEKVCLRLDDGSTRYADHVLLGTGYRVSIARYAFLPDQLTQTVRGVNGYPVLNSAFESSVDGLHFVGAPAAYSFGPLCRFVAGTGYTAATLTRAVTKAHRRSAAKAGLRSPVLARHREQVLQDNR